MSLKYTIVRQAQPGIKGGGSYNYYARACERSKATLDDLADMIHQRTSLSRGDVVSVVVSLSDLIPELLSENKTVELGELGTFSLHLQSEGVSSPEEISYRKIKALKIQFRPGIHFKRAIGRVNFVKSDKSSF